MGEMNWPEAFMLVGLFLAVALMVWAFVWAVVKGD